MLEQPSLGMALMPMIIVFFMYGLIFGTVCYLMAKNKGLKDKNYFLLGMIPVVGWMYPVIILSKPNQIIMDKLNAIEARLNQL